MAEHYAGRITYWEIWNEPDFDPDLPNGISDAPRLSEGNFADILTRGSQTIKDNNPDAKIILGGLSSPWPAVNTYYLEVLDSLKENYGQVTPPYDYFASHPYSSGRIGHSECDPGFPCYGISPQEYMLQSPAHGNAPNFLHKFQNTFAEVYEGEPEPPVWITEIGWNASLESDKNRNCEEQLLVSGVGQNNEQAEYLWNSFDILSEIPQLNSSQPAIEKVFWYQYLDIMVETPGRCRGNRVNDTTPNSAAVIRWRHDTAWHQSDGQPSRSVCSPQDADMAWFFGLFEPDCDNLIAPGYQPSQRPKPYQACAFKLFDRQQETIFADLNWQACNLFTASESSSRDEARVTSDYMLELNWLIYGASLVEQYNIYHATVPDLAAATFVGTVPTYFPTMAFPDGKPYQWLDEHSEHGITHYYWIYEQSLGTQGGNPIKEFEIHLPLPPMPSVSIRHNGETLARNAEITVRANQDFTLEWQSTNATACWASGGWRGAKNLTDSETLPGFTKKSKTFRLECFNAARQKFTTRVIVRTTDDEFEANNPFDPNPCICPPNNDQ